MTAQRRTTAPLVNRLVRDVLRTASIVSSARIIIHTALDTYGNKTQIMKCSALPQMRACNLLEFFGSSILRIHDELYDHQCHRI